MLTLTLLSHFQYLMNWLKTGNKEIAKIAKKYHCNVMTDISGFGLASHLGDICKSSDLTAKISLKSEILINSNINILKKYQSTGFKNNYLSSSKEISISEEHLLKNILYDPQTNGPLLFSINKNHKDEFKKESLLRENLEYKSSIGLTDLGFPSNFCLNNLLDKNPFFSGPYLQLIFLLLKGHPKV